MAYNSMVGTLLDKATLIRDPLKKPLVEKDVACWRPVYTKLLVLILSVVGA